MDTGVVTAESLSQLLRTISQRRRQGTLAVKYGDHEVQVAFLQGRVVSVADSRTSEASAVAMRLLAAGYLSVNEISENCTWSEVLAAVAKQSGPADATSVVQRAYRAEVLDRLYQLNVGNGAVYSFSSHMVDYERDLAPTISVGQLLLDLVALESDGARFDTIFPKDCSVLAASRTDAAVTEEEAEILAQTSTAIAIGELWNHVLLSRYHFMEALLSLHERGLVEVTSGAPGQSGSQNHSLAFGDDIFAMLDKTIDESVAEEVEGDPAPTVELPPIGVADAAPQVQGVRETLSLISARWLQNAAIPATICWLALCAGILAPLTLWLHVFEFFGRR